MRNEFIYCGREGKVHERTAYETQKELVTHKKESAFMRFNARDFPEHGVSLIVPSDPSFGHLQAKLDSTSIHDPYSVLLRNTGTRAVVGYSIKWQCFDGRGDYQYPTGDGRMLHG
jgi:hypothetical protein